MYSAEWTEEQACEVANLLTLAAEPLTNRSIAKRLGLPPNNNGAVRSIIHHLRVHDIVPMLVAGHDGYWISDDPDEVELYIHSLHERAKSIEVVALALQCQLQRYRLRGSP